MTKRLRLSLILGVLLIAAQSAIAAAAVNTPEIWFFLRSYNMNPQNSHGVEGQQGWNRLFVEPDASWPPFMDHVQVVALAGAIKATPDDVYTKTFAKLKEKNPNFPGVFTQTRTRCRASCASASG
jgi:hypothetical protein